MRTAVVFFSFFVLTVSLPHRRLHRHVRQSNLSDARRNTRYRNSCCVFFSLFLYSRVVAIAPCAMLRCEVTTRACPAVVQHSAVPPGSSPGVQLHHGETQWQQRRRPRRKGRALRRRAAGRLRRRKPPESAASTTQDWQTRKPALCRLSCIPAAIHSAIVFSVNTARSPAPRFC